MPAHGLPEPLIPDFGQSMAAYRQGFGLGNDQRVNALNQQAGAIAATGDMKGASNALLSGGELSTGLGIQDRLQAAEDRKRAQALQDRQLGMQTQKMGWEIEDRKIAKAEKVNGAFARMAMAVKNAPEHQRGALWGQVIEQGRKLGADVTGYEDPSSIDMALAKSSETAEYLAYLKSQAKAGGLTEVSPGATMYDPVQNKGVYTAPSAPPKNDAPSGYRQTADGSRLEIIPGGPADPANTKPHSLTVTDITKLSEEGTKYGGLTAALNTFKPEYSGYMADAAGQIALAAGRKGLAGKTTQDAASWWQGYDRMRNVVRHDLYGSALTPNEQKAFEAADITSGMDPNAVQKNLGMQTEIIKNGLKRKANAMIQAGYDPAPIAEAYGLNLKDIGVTSTGRGKRETAPPDVSQVPKPQGASDAQIIDEARKAVMSGKDPAAVRQQLQAWGIKF